MSNSYNLKKTRSIGNIPTEDIFLFDMKNLPLDINSIGTTNPNKKYIMKRSRDDNSLIVFEFVLQGKIYIKVDDKEFTAQAGDTYILLPNTDQYYYSDSSDPVKKVWINLESNYLENLLLAHGLSANVYHIDTSDLFENIFDVIHSSPSYNQTCSDISKIIFKFILRLSQLYNENEIDLPLKIKNYVDSIVYTTFDYNKLSETLYLSASTLIRKFKKAYKITPYEYYLQQKIKLASRFLTETNLSVTEISDRFGFEDVHYFSNIFKKRTGISPTEYRIKSKSLNQM